MSGHSGYGCPTALEPELSKGKPVRAFVQNNRMAIARVAFDQPRSLGDSDQRAANCGEGKQEIRYSGRTVF